MEPQAAPTKGLKSLGFLDCKEVATILELSPRTLRNWRARGLGPPYTKVHGTRIAYPIDGLTNWLKQRTTAQPRAHKRVHGKLARSSITLKLASGSVGAFVGLICVTLRAVLMLLLNSRGDSAPHH